MTPTKAQENIRDQYSKVATCCAPSCCGDSSAEKASRAIGYSDQQLADIPAEANLGLGCGNPTAIASLRPGETVLDLGSGAGIDAFLAAKAVTSTGRVIGVDMTPAMLEKARRLAVKNDTVGYVEFREGYIEALPVASESVDVVISNCVINLAPDKQQVFNEAFRVLKSGGRLAISDLCLSEPLPPEVAQSSQAVVACIGGASLAEDYLSYIKTAGFSIGKIDRVAAGALLDPETACADPLIGEVIKEVGPELMLEAAKSVWSYRIEATKP